MSSDNRPLPSADAMRDPTSANSAGHVVSPATPPKHERDNKADPADEESGTQRQEVSQQNATTLAGYRLAAVAIGVCFGALMISVDISILGTVRVDLSLWGGC